MGSELALIAGDYWRAVWAAVAIVCALALAYGIRRYTRRLAGRRPEDPQRLRQLRRRETALVLVETLVRYGVTLVALFALISIFVEDTTAAVGGGALVVLLVAFSVQRFLADVSAGFLILLEGWYAVGDFVTINPDARSGVVEVVGLRTTVLRSFNGDRQYIPNGQITSATRSPRGYRRYSIEILTRNPEDARRAIAGVALRAPAGEARFLRPPEVVEEREAGEGAWLVRAQAHVPPTLEWLAEGLLVAALKEQLDESTLLRDPIVYTIDEGALSRYERRVLIS